MPIMTTTTPHPDRPEATDRPGGLLASMRIRKKLILLHTVFSLVLAGILLVALRPAIANVVARAEKMDLILQIQAPHDRIEFGTHRAVAG